MGDKRVRKERLEGDRLHKERWVTKECARNTMEGDILHKERWVTKECARKRWRAIDCTRKDG